VQNHATIVTAACSQNVPSRRSKAEACRNVFPAPVVLAANRLREHKAVNETSEKKRRPPPVIEQKSPEPELEEKLRRDPTDKDAKVDVGSDESMDASDPPSVVQPENNEPVPSSGFDEDRESKP
jgi:hypothetical protein